MSESNLPSIPNPPARRRSGGPRSAAGKAIASRNALTHGLGSQLTVIDGEDAGEFEGLVQGLVDDFRPQGTTETLIVHRVANLVWKQRRLDRFEHEKVTQAALAPVGMSEIFRKMDHPLMVELCRPYFDSLDEFDDADFQKAESLSYECDEFQRVPHLFLDPTRCDAEFPVLSNEFSKHARALNDNAGDVFGLGNPAADPAMLELASEEIERYARWARAVVFLVKHRDQIHRARAAIRAEKIAQAWNLERSHRYHSLLENQLYKALKELRMQQLWRNRQGLTIADSAPGLGDKQSSGT